MDFIFPRIQDFPEYIQYKFNDLVAAGVDEKAAMIVAARSGKRFDPQFNPGEIFTFEPNDTFGQAYMFLSGQKPKPYTYVSDPQRRHSPQQAHFRLQHSPRPQRRVTAREIRRRRTPLPVVRPRKGNAPDRSARQKPYPHRGVQHR